MAEPAAAGHVYRIGLRDGKPAHYWIILNDPQLTDGTFLAVSFTDRHNLDAVPDIWETGYAVCAAFALSKPSVLALNYAVVKTQVWLDGFDAGFVGMCTTEALRRARCNFVWYPRFLRPVVSKYARPYEGEWRTSCGDPPQRCR